MEADQIGGFEVGGEIKADIFEDGQIVDAQGVTQGKGFMGTIKRWNFTMGDATHGNRAVAPLAGLHRPAPGRRVACSRARRCPATWATCTQTTQNLKWSRSMPSAA